MAFFDKPKAEGEGGGGGGAPKNFLTKDMGPLPVWGWAALAVASIFLFRMMTKPKVAPVDPSADKSKQTPVPYPTGGVGGVFLIPSGSNAQPAAATPPATTPAPSTTKGLWDYLNLTAGRNLATLYRNSGVAPEDANGRAFLTQTASAASLGMPHVTSEGGVGYVTNPATGQRVLASTFNAMSEDQRMKLTIGDQAAWAAI